MEGSVAVGYGPDHSFVLNDGRTGWWVARHPDNRSQRDSNGHPVGAREPRGWVRDSSGTTTKASHGNARRYYCPPCMDKLGAPEVPRW
jgi:hypothetical protein